MRKLLQHVSHTLQPFMGILQAVVWFSWPQLFGTMHLHVSMQLFADSVPSGSNLHCPIVELQLYLMGVGAGGIPVTGILKTLR